MNKVIAAEAERERVTLNVVDDAELCTFIAPAIVKKGAVTVALSTGGASPALARKLREGLETSEAWNTPSWQESCRQPGKSSGSEE